LFLRIRVTGIRRRGSEGLPDERDRSYPKGESPHRWTGKTNHLEPAEGIAQAAGFRPERLARVSGEHHTVENIQAHFKEKRDDLYSRYRLAKAPEDKQRVMRDMQRFNMDSRKYRGVTQSITATSLRQATRQKPEKDFLSYGGMTEANY
jgi:hypothetical protein